MNRGSHDEREREEEARGNISFDFLPLSFVSYCNVPSRLVDLARYFHFLLPEETPIESAQGF